VVGAGRQGAKPNTWTADPLEPAIRPLMLCDLCETFRVDYTPDADQVPHSVTAHVPIPPFRTDYARPAGGFYLDAATRPLRFAVRKLQCACRLPTDRQERDALAGRVCEAFCADARRDINDMLVNALMGHARNPRTTFYDHADGDVGGGTYLSGALAALCKSPGLQFPLDFVCVIPSSRLACLLPASAGQSVLCGPDGKTRVNVSGLDFVAYSPSLLDSDVSRHHYQPAFVMPRRGSLGLALSDIAIRAEQVDGQLCFSGSYLVGNDILWPDGIVCARFAASNGA